MTCFFSVLFGFFKVCIYLVKNNGYAPYSCIHEYENICHYWSTLPLSKNHTFLPNSQT